MSEWQSVPLWKVTTKIGSGATPRGGKQVYREDGVAFIRSQNVYDGRFSSEGLARITDDAAVALRNVAVQAGDVLVNITGESVTRTALVPKSALPARVSQHVSIVRPDPTQLDSRYLMSALLNPPTKAHLEALSSAGATRRALTKSHLEATEILLPPLPEQRRIAAVLGAFDDLIDTNLALADQLHDAARSVGLMMLDRYAERPDVPLTDVATISRGFSYKSTELVPGADTLVNLKNFGRGGVFNHEGFKPLASNRFKLSQVVEPGDVAISMTDLTQQREVIARPIRIPRAAVEGKMIASLDLAIARPLNGHDREFIAAALSQEAFHSFARDYCNGTTVLHMSIRAFDDYAVPSISPEEAAPFTKRIRVLNEAEDACRDEIGDLTRTRDELLPLLMSGRVRVEDVLEEAD